MSTLVRNPFVLLVVGVTALAALGCDSNDDNSKTHDSGTDAAVDSGSDAGHSDVDSGPVSDAGETHDAAASGDDAGGEDPCLYTADLQFGHGGGFIQSQTTAELSKPGKLVITQSIGGPQPSETSCMPKLPACGSSGVVDIAEIVADLARADVKATFALSDPPTYGALAIDTGIFHVSDATGKGFSATGRDCDEDSGVGDCTDPPAGVQKLIDDLQALLDQGLADKACKNL